MEVKHLSIGGIIVSQDPIIVSTVLGSCISLCLFSPTRQAGGMIHYGLPAADKQMGARSLRYGNVAIPRLIEELSSLTHEPASAFTAKIIGGACNLAKTSTQCNVGNENVAIARILLGEFGISIIAEDVGGSLGRKALFHVQSGRLQSALLGAGYSRKLA